MHAVWDLFLGCLGRTHCVWRNSRLGHRQTVKGPLARVLCRALTPAWNVLAFYGQEFPDQTLGTRVTRSTRK